MKFSSKDGFTLVELAVVLVIIGFIVSGVVGGQTLVRNAQLMSIVSDIETFRGAVEAFEIKYTSLPGDMPDADSYWGADCAGGSQDNCNGNGDGNIEWHNTIEDTNESFPAWQHLQLAEMIVGGLTGLIGGTGAMVNENAPEAKIKGTGYIFHTGRVWLGADKQTGNHIRFGGVNTFAGEKLLDNGVLTSPEAQALDRKIDDGDSDAGKVYASNGFNTPVGSECGIPGTFNGIAAAVSVSNYDLSNTDESCVMFFYF